MAKKTISIGKRTARRREKDFGEELGGQTVSIRGAAPLRIIIGGPPHSGKSTLMHLLEDKFNEYGVPVELVDMDLSAPTDLRSKEGFTVTRDKRDWTPELAEEAAAMFIDSDSEIVLGDSVGLISSITEILSQPADVAILIASGNKGDDHEVYKQVIRKWKNFFTDVDTPLLVVVRSSLNPDDLSMFDPQDNYGVVVGLDRKAFEEGVINPQDACIEGMVFEVGQAFDLVFTSPMTEKHRAIIEAKWPSVKDIDTWTPENATNLSPEKRAFLSNLERNYFEQKRREKYQLGDEYRAEGFDAERGKNYRGKSVNYELIPSVEIEGVGIVSEGSPYLKNNYNVKWDDYNIYDDDAAEVIFSIPANDSRMPLQEGELKLIEAIVYGFNHPLADASWGELNERGMFWAGKTMEELANYEAEGFDAENFNAYPTRFSPKNPNTRSKMVSRGRRIVQDDPEYQQFRKYSFAGIGILGLGLYLFARKSNSDNDSNNG